MRGIRGAVLAGCVWAMAAACGAPEGIGALNQFTMTYDYVITPDDVPPHAGQIINYTVVVSDRATRQPIQGGEGRIFASNIDGAKTWDGFVYGPEVGTYHAKLSFIVSGTWAVAIQFRRDSLVPVERTDWQQDVLNERSSNAQ